MPRWKTTQNLLGVHHDGEYFDENWMNYDKLSQYAPKIIPWDGSRPIRFEDVDIWEVISEWTGLCGVYAAYMPYAEYYIVMNHWKIVAEFEGYMANERLEQYLIEHNITYPKTNISPTPSNQRVVNKKLIISNNFIK